MISAAEGVARAGVAPPLRDQVHPIQRVWENSHLADCSQVLCLNERKSSTTTVDFNTLATLSLLNNFYILWIDSSKIIYILRLITLMFVRYTSDIIVILSYISHFLFL